MLITVQVTQASGKTEIINLRVEVWHPGGK